MQQKKSDLDRSTFKAEYEWEDYGKYDNILQNTWTAVRKGVIIDLDFLAPSHVTKFLELCLEFFTGLEPITIYFQSSKGRLAKVKSIGKQNHLRYKKIGNKASIHVGKLYE